MKGTKDFKGLDMEDLMDLKNFKPINPDGVKGTILSGCDLPGDAVCGCLVIEDPGHHCSAGPPYIDA